MLTGRRTRPNRLASTGTIKKVAIEYRSIKEPSILPLRSHGLFTLWCMNLYVEKLITYTRPPIWVSTVSTRNVMVLPVYVIIFDAFIIAGINRRVFQTNRGR